MWSSHTQQCAFNTPLQMRLGTASDELQQADTSTFSLQPGDLVLSGEWCAIYMWALRHQLPASAANIACARCIALLHAPRTRAGGWRMSPAGNRGNAFQLCCYNKVVALVHLN